MPLTLANPGEENVIRKIGGMPDVRKHLEDMGFTVGSRVLVVSQMAGSVIVNIRESRVAVSREMAQKIMI